MSGSTVKMMRRDLRRTIGDSGMALLDQHTLALNKLFESDATQDDQIHHLQRHYDTQALALRQAQAVIVRVESMLTRRRLRDRLRWLLTGH